MGKFAWLIAAACLFLANNVSSYVIGAPNFKNVYCKSEECKAEAKSILSNMNQNVDPCDNFYEFACGGFVNKTKIPEDRTGVNTFSSLDDNLEKQLHESLAEDIKPNDLRPFKLAKKFFKSCMNENYIKEQDLKPLLETIEALGGWPVLQPDWNEASFEWKKFVYNDVKLGYSSDYFISFNVDTDMKNSSRRMIGLDKARLALSRKYLVQGLENKIVQAYSNYMVEVAVILGADKERAEEELKEVLDLEVKLANISLPAEARRDSMELYHPMTVDELTEKYQSIPWKEYFNRLLLGSTSVSGNEVLNVAEPMFVHGLEKILNETSPRVLANYAVWRVIKDSVSLTLNEKLRAAQLKFGSVMSGVTERPPRWKECVGVVSGEMHMSVAALYIRKHFDVESRKNIQEMVSFIQKQLRKTIETVEWMDEQTREAALKKIDAMKNIVAYPNELEDDAIVENYYESLSISPDNYFQNNLNLNRLSYEKGIRLLREPIVDRNDWTTISNSIAIVNAFYWPNYNTIVLPAGILHGKFFNKNRPQYMNYGSVGWVIGHEITHGFDDQGSQYNDIGNFVEWWKQETKKKYLEKAQCIVQQYSNFKDDEVGLSLNGVNTQGENIADNGGLKTAYHAYKVWASQYDKPEPRLPGLDYKPEQMFWISAANTWCSKYRPEYLKNLITTDVHSPSKYRVIGSFSNMEDFAKDFKCPSGTLMNPRDKCSVW